MFCMNFLFLGIFGTIAQLIYMMSDKQSVSEHHVASSSKYEFVHPKWFYP